MLCEFQVYNKVMQLYISVHSISSLSISFPNQVVTEY